MRLEGENGDWKQQKKRTAIFLGTANRLDGCHRLDAVHCLVAVHRLVTVHRMDTVRVLVLDKNTAFQKLEWFTSSEKSLGTH